MSIKSLLQIILFLLIIIIVGAIYYLYFYSGPINILSIKDSKSEKIEEIVISDENSSEEVILEENNFSKKDEIKKIKKDEQVIEEKTIENVSTNKNNKKDSTTKKVENLTKEIEYIITKKNGDTYKITSEYGKTNTDNSDILDLEIVNGVISSAKRSKIFISSKYAKYNYNSQNSKFYKNVEIKYDGKTINCNNLDLYISENVAVAFGNVIVKDDRSIMKAQMITLDTLTKNIEVNANNKIKIITN